MGLQIYAGKGFDTQKAERFFKERRIAYQRVDVLKYGIGRRELESVAAAVGLDALERLTALARLFLFQSHTCGLLVQPRRVITFPRNTFSTVKF